MSTDRLDAFTRLVGGEQNSPPALPSPPPAQAATGSDQTHASSADNKVLDAFGNMQTCDELLASTPYPAPPAPGYENRHAIKAQFKLKNLGRDSSAEDFTLDPRKGEPSAINLSFCTFVALTKFPYKYIDSEYRQRVATASFDGGKVWDRQWDIYYVWSDQSLKPITLVPLHQAQALIDEVNAKFSSINFKFGTHHEKDGLVLTFDDPDPKYRPRFLGSTDSRAKYDYFVESVDPLEDSEDMTLPEDRGLKAFKAKITLATNAARAKNKKRSSEKHETTLTNRSNMGQQLLQAQRFLGLRPGPTPPSLSGAAGLTISPINVDQPAAHPCDSDVIIISIDVEAWERAHDIITEVGVSTLDTRDLQGTAPGENGKNWQQFVRARHFRVIEHRNIVNRDYVAGCPDKFDFGESEWVGLQKMPNVLAQCFQEPFSKPVGSSYAYQPYQVNYEEFPQLGSTKPGAQREAASNEKRNIVLLGHDIQSDIQYCHKLGFSVLKCANLLATIDTQAMYQAYTHNNNQRGLGTIMIDFNIAAWHKHNGGNDAVYTVWAMLATCVQDAAERGTDESKKKIQERANTKLNEAIESAKEKAKEDAEGWDAMGSEDGGVPLLAPPSASGHYTFSGQPLDL